MSEVVVVPPKRAQTTGLREYLQKTVLFFNRLQAVIEIQPLEVGAILRKSAKTMDF